MKFNSISIKKSKNGWHGIVSVEECRITVKVISRKFFKTREEAEIWFDAERMRPKVKR